MDTRLTLADVRPILGPMINSSDLNDPLILQRINEGEERLINSGKWKGCIVTLRFESSSGFVTMPYNFAAALALTYDRYPFPIFTQFHQYVEEGPGKMDEALNWPGILIDLGDGYCTQADIPAAGVVRIYSSALDNGDVVRVYGNLNGVTVYDSSGNEGEAVTLAAPFVATTNQFTEITGFTKPLTTARVYAKSWDGVTETLVGTYQPNETRPCYRRYQTGVAEKEIRLICHRRFIPTVAETDWIIPGNISALRAIIQSLLFEDASDMDAADASFARALSFLNDEAKTFRGGGRATLNTNPTPWTATLSQNVT
jgi:hypothetical protein